MSEADDKHSDARPWDPAGTQPKHDPESLLPQADEPLIPPEAEVVESDAIDEDAPDGDLLPERRPGAGAPALAGGGKRHSAYAPRFQFLTGALVAIGIAAIAGITIAIVGINPGGDSGPAWSGWKPANGGMQGASEIADHVSAQYREAGKQLVKVEANDISYKGIPLTVALRKSAEQGGAIQVHDEKGVLFQMCGLGLNCAIDVGKPSKERAFLLRREGLELALYTLHYLKDVKQVVVLIPATPGKAQTVALYFTRDAVKPELDRPLTASLLPTAPSIKNVTLSPDAALVGHATDPYLFSLMGSSFNDRGFLVLDPYTPEGDKALQKRLKQQSEQAAAAAASAATQSGG
jgi:hypothetical protein